jgi:hypothetical protein
LPHQFPRKDKTMNDGIKIILERMKTNPEEFVGNLGTFGRWENMVQMSREVLTEEENKAFDDALHELKRKNFTTQVLQVLMEEPVKIDPTTNTISNTGRNFRELLLKDAKF